MVVLHRDFAVEVRNVIWSSGRAWSLPSPLEEQKSGDMPIDSAGGVLALGLSEDTISDAQNLKERDCRSGPGRRLVVC